MAEFDELQSNCIYTWTTLNGVNGYLVTSKKNGNSIFLPASGYRYETSVGGAGSVGSYWSSSLKTDYPSSAVYLYFYLTGFFVDYGNRFFSHPVRPVTE